MNISPEVSEFIEKTEPIFRELSEWIEIQEQTLGVELQEEEIDRKKIELLKARGLTHYIDKD